MFKYRLITPKKPVGLDRATLNARLTSVIRAVINGAEADFKATTATWAHKPSFKKLIGSGAHPLFAVESGAHVGSVFTEDPTYILLDRGAREHAIVARNAPALSYQTLFKPKTTPGVLSSQSGGKSGPWVDPKPQWVWHPGHKPRKFEITVKERYEKIFHALALNMMANIARESGHKI